MEFLNSSNDNNKKLTKKEKRTLRKNRQDLLQQEKLNFSINHIEPLTDHQRETFEAYNKGRNLLLYGSAGTGKTFLSLYLATKTVLAEHSDYKKVVIVRSVVPTRDMGFLPGNSKEKTRVYEAPYYAIYTELFERGDAYDYLKNRGIVEFISTSFIRGITLNDCIVIVDEMQNMDWGELTSIITRVGKNCKIIFSGDFRQSDFRFKERESKHDINRFMEVLKSMKHDFSFIEFDTSDIVRSKLVKNFIIAINELGYDL